MLTYWAANQILQAMTGRANTISLASNCYVGLSKTNPTREGTSLEEPPANYTYVDPETGAQTSASTGYERQLIGTYNGSEDAKKMGAPVQGVSTNQDIVYFPEVLDVSNVPGLSEETKLHPWGTVAYFCIFSAKNGGQLIAYSPIVRYNEQTGEYEQITLTPTVSQLPIIRKGQVRLEIE